MPLLSHDYHWIDLAGKPFVLSEFMGRFNDEGMIPIPLMEAELIASDTAGPMRLQLSPQ